MTAQQPTPQRDSSDVIADLTPEGLVHRSWMISRGWSSGQVNEHLTAHEVRVEGVPPGYSPRFYPISEVKRVEETVPEVRKAVADRASIIPSTLGRDEDYGLHNTIPRAVLVSRGWTAAHLKRLLDHPDYIEPASESYRYGTDRVELAEQVDEKLRKRLDQVAAKKATEKAAAIGQALAAQVGVWRRVGDRWLVQIAAAAVGDTITVRRKDGSTEPKVVRRLVRDDGDSVLVDVTNPQRAAPIKPKAATPPPASAPAQVAEPTGPRTWEHLAPYSLHPGDVIRDGDRWVTVVSARPWRISDDDPSMYGSDLLGHEGQMGTMARVRVATDEEAAPAQARLDAEIADRDRRVAKARTIKALIEHAEAPRQHGDASDVTRGEVLHDNRNPYGSGGTLRVDGEDLIYVQGNGMDGDNWAYNDAPGVIVWVAPAPTDLIEQLRRMNVEVTQ